MMSYKYCLTAILSLLFLSATAQYNTYSIQLKYKGPTSFSLSNPGAFLSAAALDRRIQYNIAVDSTDLPINQAYLDSISNAGNVTILSMSKWLNQVYITTTDANALAKINAFSFVQASKTIAPKTKNKISRVNKTLDPTNISETAELLSANQTLGNYFNYGSGYTQVHMLNGEFLHNLGFRGENMKLAVTDAGFDGYATIKAFDSIRNNNQIKDTWDYLKRSSDVEGDNHGTNCLSTIVSNLPGSFIGTAPKSSLYLYRTEDAVTEYPIEECNLVAAYEKADSLGVQLISTSLGYNVFDGGLLSYTYANMDGNTTVCARGADLAAKKGMLLIVANGNAGNLSWKYITTPADADSVLSVGAVNSAGTVASFSSYGPTYDGQVKPDVAALGVNATIVTPTGAVTTGNGTSFACPITAGLTTCLWQAFPEVNNMTVIDEIRKSGSIYNAPNNRIGYGISNFKKAFIGLERKLFSQQVDVAFCQASIDLKCKAGDFFTLNIERKLNSESAYSSVYSQVFTGAFSNRTVNFKDDISSYTGQNINYRFKLSIDSDTTFFLDSVTINVVNPCITYTFNGDGNWDDVNNWLNGIKPPLYLPDGSTIIVDPIEGGLCILNTPQHIMRKSALIIKDNKKLLIPENIMLE